MLRQFLATILLLILFLCANAQQSFIDGLLVHLNSAKNDTSRLIVLRSLSRAYAEMNPDSASFFAEEALTLARKLTFRIDEGGAMHEIGYALVNKGNYPRALQTLLEAKAILEDPKGEKNVIAGKFEGDDEFFFRTATPRQQRLNELAFVYQLMGLLYANTNNFEKARKFHLLGLQVAAEAGWIPMQGILNLTLNRVYLNLHKTDSALLCIKQSYDQFMQSGYKRYLGSTILNMGRTYLSMGDTVLANEYFRRSAVVSKEYGYSRGYFAASLLLADHFIGVGAKDSALYYVRNAQQVVKTLNSPEISLRAYNTWARYYYMVNNNDSIVKYQALIIHVTNSLYNIRNLQQFENINFEEHQKQLAVETARKEIRDTWRIYVLLAGLFIILIIVVILWRNNRHRRMANDQLSMQKNSLESTLSDLRSAQSRLIHSEKMASLGELTAGIAHEIQNPLNFVNNFSELNSELVGELEAAAERGNFAEIKNIIKDIRENEGKINHHGKRADAIVKGMLQHSRGGSRVKEPTDINALCDEYIRLAYQGHRSKDKSFTATIKTNFDETLGKINVIPQDIARIILNLISNAFYTVGQKQNQGIVGYSPVVSLSTAQINNKVEIRVADNGNGIPQNVVDKIFQPFFTTKPTGQGTGLGLSISYEIVKAHGGDLRVDTKEGEGSEFVVSFPHS